MFLALKWLFVNKAKQNKTDQMHRLNWNIQFNVWISWAKYVNKLFCLWWVLCWTGNLEHNSHYIWWAILRCFFWRRSALTWWRHQTKTFSALLALCGGNSPVTGEFPSQRPVTQSFDASLICSWINGWLNNREAGDLRRYHAYDDVTVMDVLPLITGDSSASDDVMSHIAAMTDDTVGKRRGSMNQNITSLFSWVRLGTSKPWVNVDWILYLWHHGTKIKLWYYELRSIRERHVTMALPPSVCLENCIRQQRFLIFWLRMAWARSRCPFDADRNPNETKRDPIYTYKSNK